MRKIEIDEEKCNGCGLCAAACHEGAIEMVAGKAKLVREDYCDGLGDCLPACPVGAIRFALRAEPKEKDCSARACLSAPIQTGPAQAGTAEQAEKPLKGALEDGRSQSELFNWPIQIKLASVNAPVFNGAELLIAADCTAFAQGDFHEKFLRGRVALIGCPKLDGVDYSEKLAQIIRRNDVRSVTVVRMEVPCCGGLEQAVRRAIADSGKLLPAQVVTLSRRGEIV